MQYFVSILGVSNTSYIEVEIGDLLGHGEFGEVYEVQRFAVSETCDCLKCQARENYPDQTKEPPPSIFVSLHNRADTVTSLLSLADEEQPGEDEELGQQSAIKGSDRRTEFTVTLSEEEKGFCCKPTDSCEVDGVDVDDDLSEDDDNDQKSAELHILKGRLAAHSTRDGIARYAIKLLKQDIDKERRKDAVIDLACEAKYLASITHPNIVRLRATVEVPGQNHFAIVMDRLVMTLSEKLDTWRNNLKQYRGKMGGLVGANKHGLEIIYSERMLALYDIARAMRYLHRCKILYRDIKPENIGVDVRGDMRLFDFGLARELKVHDLVRSPDEYEATGLTGSRRYMAPEVIRCVPYGFSADVYGFGILAWQILMLKMPFENFDSGKLFEAVVAKKKRPSRLGGVASKNMGILVEQSWSHDPSLRPTFASICSVLQGELGDAVPSDKTQVMVNRSIGSFRGE